MNVIPSFSTELGWSFRVEVKIWVELFEVTFDWVTLLDVKFWCLEVMFDDTLVVITLPLDFFHCIEGLQFPLNSTVHHICSSPSKVNVSFVMFWFDLSWQTGSDTVKSKKYIRYSSTRMSWEWRYTKLDPDVSVWWNYFFYLFLFSRSNNYQWHSYKKRKGRSLITQSLRQLQTTQIWAAQPQRHAA